MRAEEHPDDARLIARYFDSSPGDGRLEHHMSRCARCATRQRDIAAALDDETAAPLTTDAALHLQRRRILHRLERIARPGARVLAFPHMAAPAAAVRRASPMRARLAAVAVIVALVGAAGAGWVLETQRHEGLPLRATAHPSRVTAPGQPGHDSLLSDIDMALARPQTPALRALDALTAGAAEAPRGR